MPQVNEQLERLWNNDIPDGTNNNAEALKYGLVEMEKGNGVDDAGVHQVDNSSEHS